MMTAMVVMMVMMMVVVVVMMAMVVMMVMVVMVVVAASHLAITEQQPTPLLRMIVGYSSAVYLPQSQLTLSITIVLLGAAVNTYT